MTIILYLIKIHFIINYFFIKLFTKQKKRVYLLSRQYDKPSLNYKYIIEELEENNINYKVKCQKIESSINDSMRTHGNYSKTSSLFIKIIKNFKSAIKYYISLWSQMISIASSKVIIVDGYNLPVSLLKHKKGTKIIQIWHSLGAIKMFGYQSIGKQDGINPKVAKILKMHEGYDYVVSGSEGMAKYFAEAFNVPINKVITTGTPTVDYLRLEKNDIKEKILKDHPEFKNKINILYSPTFRNNDNYNFQDLIDNIDFNKMNLIISYHFKIKETELDNRVIIIPNNEYCAFDLMTVCDYVISDYSALLVDAAISNTKILMYLYDYDEYSKNNGINIDFFKDYKNISFKDAKSLIDIIKNDKYDIKEFNKFKQLYTPSKDINSTEELMKIITNSLKEK